MEPVYRALEIAAHTVARLQDVRLDVRGEHHIPSHGGAVIALNHTGYVDFLSAALGVHRAGRRVRYLIKSEMMDNASVRFLIVNTHTVPVDRSAGSEAFATAVEYLREGFVLGVYPEATISRSFELKEFKTGAVRMAAGAQVPIVPTIVWGAHRQWTKTGNRGTTTVTRDMGRSHLPVSVRFAEPMWLGADRDPAQATAELKRVMRRMLHEVRADYGEHPPGAFWVPASMGGGAPTEQEAHEIEAAEAQEKAAARARGRGHEPFDGPRG